MLRSWLTSRTARRQTSKTANRARLSAESLELRALLSSTQAFEGLQFATDGDFQTQTVGNVVHVRTNSPVEVGRVPTAGASFDPLIRLSGGVDLVVGGQFTASGAIDAVVGGQEVPLAAASTRQFSAGELLSGGVPIDGLSLPIAGASFAPSTIELDAEAVKLQGELELPQLAGIEVPIQGGDAVMIDGAGIRLTALDESISGSFDTLGVTIDADDVGVTYDAANDSFGIFGAIHVTSSGNLFNKVGATLGTAGAPGLIIEHGKVEELDIAVDGTMNLYGLSLSTKDLDLHYVASTGMLQVLGGIGFGIGESLSLSASLSGDGLTIDTRTGQVAVSGIDLEGSGDLGPVHIDNLNVRYQKSSAGSTWDASGMVQIAPGVEVGGSFSIVDGKLSAIGIAYDSPTGIPIGDTGLYLTHAGGTIDHIDHPADITVSLDDVTVVFGKQVRFLNQNYSMFSATGTLTVDEDKLVLDGKIELVGGLLGSGTAKITLDWADKNYSVHYDTAMYDGVFQQTGDLVLNGSNSMDLVGQADLNAPASIRSELKQFGLPTTFADASFHLHIVGGRPADQNYVEASFDMSGLTATVRYDFSNNLTLTIRSGAVELLNKAIDAAGHAVTDTFNSAGRLATRIKEAGSQISTETFDAAGHAATSTIETFNAAGTIARRVTMQAGETVTETFNAAGKIAQHVTQTAQSTVTESFDQFGKLSQRVTHQAGQVITETFVLGHRTAEQVEKMITVDFGGFPMQMKSIVTQSFDLFGSVSKTVSQTIDSIGESIETVIARAGSRVTELAGKTITETLDAAGTVTRRVTDTLDSAGHVTKEVIETFDSFGHETKKIVRNIGNALNPLNW